jgi:hypothetical protein
MLPWAWASIPMNHVLWIHLLDAPQVGGVIGAVELMGSPFTPTINRAGGELILPARPVFVFTASF